MLRNLRHFVANDDGAVTSDWVVITAGIVTAVTYGMLLIRTQAIDAVAKIFFWVDQSGI